jgi:DNA helicase-2/ATP-dependent DNA helicase PcrA
MQANLLESLNEPQLSAVTAPEDHLLVLAGAGSGKTRVLVQRIAWLIQQHGISPQRILAVTFTNKAAAEMRARVEALLKTPMQNVWIGTFHGMAHRMLRRHWQEAKLPQGFQIIDSEDQLRLIRRIHKQLNLDEAKWPVKQAQWFINQQKEEGRRYSDVKHDDLFTEMYARVYQIYENLCQSSGLVDFSEILLRSYELLVENPEILSHYQERFAHILVDEFQDTNHLQYNWLKKLAGNNGKLLIVGDDDQSIYSWRGAKSEHLTRFIKDYPSAQTIRLEQNYRSTAVILNAANTVIAHNQQRLGKNLWTDGKEGEPISVYAAFNDRDEARFIIGQIQDYLENGGARREIALLYRSNAQSRVLEEELIQKNIPYRIYGGLRYFERAEIKDALAYMRLLANRDDDGAFDRVVNTPARGIGETTLAHLRQTARDHNLSLWRAAELLIATKGLTARAATAIAQFLSLIQRMADNTAALNLADKTAYILNHSGLIEMHRLDHSERGLSRLENLEELINATSEYKPDPEEVELDPLLTFLAHVTLETGEHQAEHFEDSVHLMTLHAAKGLEFPIVFLTGMEENLFPHSFSNQDPKQLEEERRLCYVGMTRAMSKLYLTYAESRHLHGREMRQVASRFIREIPPHLLSEAFLRTKVSLPMYYKNKAVHSDLEFSNPDSILGRRVRHQNFGEGVVLNQEGDGEHARVQVSFQSGTKWLIMAYAKLELL